jgi:hypothetical protein
MGLLTWTGTLEENLAFPWADATGVDRCVMPQRAPPAGRFIAAGTLAAWLLASAVLAAGASPTRTEPTAPAETLGSVYEYEQSAPPPSGGYGTSLWPAPRKLPRNEVESVA